VSQSEAALVKVLDAFRSTAGPSKPAFLQAHLAYAPTEEEARRAAHEQWRQNVHPSSVTTEIRTVAQMTTLGENIRPDELDGAVRISSSLQQHIDWIGRDLERFDAVYLHEVGLDQRRFIEAFGREVLPQLRS
jgi:alkanesulfonate monooxygenase SsuD/methylene tetrahydromethanopterin reductase-like flavin-dependent oxidoreductase (luciferase family)